MTRKYFGTDGIRGTVGEGVITPQFFLKFGWALGKVLRAKTEPNQPCKVLIGKDTRISGYMFESAIEAGLISAGVDVLLLGPMPTPAIAYLARTFQASAGIVISASHNAFTDNGIKVFNGEGRKLDDKIELEIEAMLDQEMDTAETLGRAKRVTDAVGRYIEFCKGSVPWGFTLRDLNIVLDCAHGATYDIAPKVFSELGAKITVIGNVPDGLNINRDCGATKLDVLCETVKSSGADLGIAFDGDGDRVMFVDHRGEVIDGDQILYIIAQYRLKETGVCPGVVGTLMSNFGLEVAFKDLGVGFERAKVGDRYVIEAMARNEWPLGGESSGHIVCSDVTTTGDGIVAALQTLRAIIASGKSLAEVKQGMSMFPQVMINVPVVQKINVDQDEVIQESVACVEKEMAGKGRVLLRPSGTEPLIRVMVEGEDIHEVEQLAKSLASVVRSRVA